MRKFAVLFKEPLLMPRAKTFDARSMKDAVKAVSTKIEDFEEPLFVIDFENQRCEMVARGQSGKIRLVEDGSYGEMTNFERREY